jgi:hypothetical protein
VRKLLMALVAVAVGLLVTASAVEAREQVTVKRKTYARDDVVTFQGRALCPLVYIYSVPGGSQRALKPQRKRVRDRKFTFTRVVQRNAAFRSHWVAVRCTGRNGRLIGRVQLKVGRLPTSGAPPILPKVLLGTGLIGVGGVMLVAGRRRFPYRRRRRRRRQYVSLPAD